ncbi:hypothetical protein BDF14DRAFT_1843623 [Spinellus fusiger]|nr:hypothetical protein BDF14DRAFT_1843623 [Spinellus fusiger]
MPFPLKYTSAGTNFYNYQGSECSQRKDHHSERDDGSVISFPLPATPVSLDSPCKIPSYEEGPRRPQYQRFHSTSFGKPPSSTHSLSHGRTYKIPLHNTTEKIAPIKEWQKMMADLKKENFDLKLRLYHMKEMLSEDADLHLLEENHCLRLDIRHALDRIEALEQTLHSTFQPTLGIPQTSNASPSQESIPSASHSIGTQTAQGAFVQGSLLDALQGLHITPLPIDTDTDTDIDTDTEPHSLTTLSNILPDMEDGKVRGWLNQLIENKMTR